MNFDTEKLNGLEKGIMQLPESPEGAVLLLLIEDIRELQGKHEALKRTYGNLLAVIFRDGGHRYGEIGDDEKAREEAVKVWCKLREAEGENAYLRAKID